jgi:small subunit ribosomal protein S16
MLTIRFTRKGKKNQPFFKIVVVDKRRSAKGGRSVEEVGYFNPLTKRKSLKKERVLHWLKFGAKPSPTVHNLLVSEKIIDAKKINKSKNPKKGAEAVTPAVASAAPETTVVAPVLITEAKTSTVENKQEQKPAEAPKEETKIEVKPEEKASEKLAEPEKPA